MASDPLPYLHLASASLWAVIALFPWTRRVLPSPGMAAAQLFALTLALGGLVRLLAATTPLALPWSRTVLALGALSVLFFLLAGRWLSLQRRRADLLLALPTALVVLVEPVLGPAEPFLVRIGHLLYLYGYSAAGLAFFQRGTLVLRDRFPWEHLRIQAILAGLATGLVGTFLVGPALGSPAETAGPLASLLPLLGGVLAVASVLPLSREWFASLLRRMAEARGDVLQVFLVHKSGTILVSQAREGNPPLDGAILLDVLGVFHEFMERAFPLAGGWVDAIEHGNVKILVERGQHCLLALVTAGRENDVLRGQMRDVLRGFEARNAQALRPPFDPGHLEGGEDALGVFFGTTPVF